MPHTDRVTTADLPRIYLTLPDLEDFETVAELLYLAGAQITDKRREFVVNGPMTPEQAAAAWQAATHTDNGRGLNPRVDPPGGLDAALNALCPDGFDRDAWLEAKHFDSHGWWMEQQGRQTTARAADARR